MITFFDIAIIYSACGTPFGVYFYLQNRFEKNGLSLWLGALMHSLLWVPFAIRYLHRGITNRLHNFKFDNKSLPDSLIAPKIEIIKKEIEGFLLDEEGQMSLFDFREVIDRYCGLTLELREFRENPHYPENLEFFKYSGHPASALAGRCIQRRNLAYLSRHQTLARADLMKIFMGLGMSIQRDIFRTSSLELARILNDSDFEKDLLNLYSLSPQIKAQATVKHLENEVWISKQQPSKQATAKLKEVTATASFSKD